MQQNIKYANKQTKKHRIQKHPCTSSLSKQQRTSSLPHTSSLATSRALVIWWEKQW